MNKALVLQELDLFVPLPPSRVHAVHAIEEDPRIGGELGSKCADEENRRAEHGVLRVQTLRDEPVERGAVQEGQVHVVFAEVVRAEGGDQVVVWELVWRGFRSRIRGLPLSKLCESTNKKGECV
jgi:hypothetical protein